MPLSIFTVSALWRADIVDRLDPGGDKGADRIGVGIDQMLRGIIVPAARLPSYFVTGNKQAAGLVLLHGEEQRRYGDIRIDEVLAKRRYDAVCAVADRHRIDPFRAPALLGASSFASQSVSEPALDTPIFLPLS